MRINLTDFTFKFSGYGQYVVSYTDGRGRVYSKYTTDMPLIDVTKNAEEPKQKDLKTLKNLCKHD
jgi:hypothetical protein